MKEKQFLKMLNGKNNEDGSLTYAIVCQLLEEGKQKQKLAKPSKIRQFFHKFWKQSRTDKNPEEIVAEHFSEILDKMSNYLSQFMENVASNQKLSFLIEDNLSFILDVLKTKDSYEIVHSLKAFDEMDENFLQHHLEEILQNTIPENIYPVAQTLKGKSAECDKKIEQALEQNTESIAQYMLKEATITRVRDNTRLLQTYSRTLETITKELVESEHVSYLDIERIGRGSYSTVYAIGDKILKIGGPRGTYQIPNHERILQPLVRTNLIDEEENNKVLACMEVTQKVAKLEREDIQEEKLYKVYKELRDSGIIWTDVRYDNVGKIKGKNIPSLNGKTIKPFPSAMGMNHEIDGQDEQERLVIIDTDYIYDEKDSGIVWQSKGYAKEFERRYQQEVAREIAKKYGFNSKENEASYQKDTEGERE